MISKRTTGPSRTKLRPLRHMPRQTQFAFNNHILTHSFPFRLWSFRMRLNFLVCFAERKTATPVFNLSHPPHVTILLPHFTPVSLFICCAAISEWFLPRCKWGQIPLPTFPGLAEEEGISFQWMVKWGISPRIDWYITPARVPLSLKSPPNEFCMRPWKVSPGLCFCLWIRPSCLLTVDGWRSFVAICRHDANGKRRQI